MSTVEFYGLEGCIGELNKAVSAEKVEKALTKACLIVERAAKQKAPKGDGGLRNSITYRVADNVGVVYTNKEYAPYVEYGTGLFAENGGRTDVPWVYYDIKDDTYVTTSGMHPHPFMRPAIDENRYEIKRILREVILSD